MGDNKTLMIKNGDAMSMHHGGLTVATVSGIGNILGESEAKANRALIKGDEYDDGSNVWASWGINDDGPQKFMQDTRLLHVARRGIEINTDLHYGSGVRWFEDEITEKGKLIKKPVIIEGWNKFNRDTGFNVELSNAINHLEHLFIAFVEVIMAKGGGVHSINTLDPSYCRIKKRENGKIQGVYYDVRFRENTVDKPEAEIPIYDPTKEQDKFIMILSYKTIGKAYYPEPIITGVIENGWAEIATSVPKFIKSIYKNQMTLKYHVKIPLSAVRTNCHGWDSMDNKEKTTALKAFQDSLDETLSNAENAGKSVFTTFDDVHGLKGIEIEPLKGFIEAAKDIPSNSAANIEISHSLGVDPSEMGQGMPGGKELSGSGSDKRNGRGNKVARLKREREVSLQILHMIARLNKYDEKYYPAYVDMDTSETLDVNPTGKKIIAS